MFSISANPALLSLKRFFAPKKYYKLNVYCILSNGEMELIETITDDCPNDCMKNAIKVFGNGRTDLFWELPMEVVK